MENNFKKGDNVVMVLDKMNTIFIEQTTIKNITSKGIIKTNNGYSFDSEGTYKSQERFSTTYGYIIPYDDKGKSVIDGKKCISNIMKMMKDSSTNLNEIYINIYNNRQCDIEKLESIRDRLNLILNELNNIVEK